MTDPHPEPAGGILVRVLSILRDHRVEDAAFTGGVAVGVWAAPRQTRDIDVCGILRGDEVNRLLALHDGIRSGPEELPDLVRFRAGDWDVDLFVCKDPYDRMCLDRASRAVIDDAEVRVVTAEDLLIHKMIKLRSTRSRLLQDLADVRAVVAAQGDAIDWGYLRRWLPPQESALLESATTLDDDALVARILGDPTR